MSVYLYYGNKKKAAQQGQGKDVVYMSKAIKATENIKEVITEKVNEIKVNEAKANTAMGFVNKFVINGEEVKPAPKKTEVTINGKKLNIACRIIPDNVTDKYTNSFSIPVKDKDMKVFYCKGGGVLAASIYVDSKLEYSGISMQGIFAVVQASFGVDKLTVDRLYIASNVNRKKPAPANKATEPTPEVNTAAK